MLKATSTQKTKNTFLEVLGEVGGHYVGRGRGKEVAAAFGKEEERKIFFHFLEATDLGKLRGRRNNRLPHPHWRWA